ncbi:hypothetical protein IWX81_000821 [Salinibacterium sp. CAN_S4]|uniref:DUF559 domain-containing protein n=1 Tax=Salinibacterium sp. CAN_S4 TaxID=2787727 RepID=UPI0018EFC6DA
MSTPAPLPPELRYGPFSVAEARSLGVPDARLRRRDLVTPFRGVRTIGQPTSVVERAHSFAPILGSDQFFSHSTAAALWGMWLPRRLSGSDIDVSAIHPRREPRMTGVRGHRLGGASVRLMLRDGIPLSAPVDTWRLLGSQLSLDELVASGDSLVRRQNPLATLDELVAELDSHPAVPGIVRLRRALSWVRAGTDSPRETDLRLLIARAGLPEPTVNERVSADGAPVRFGDLVFRKWRTIVEYDGRHHRADARTFASDVLRLEQLAADDWSVIRVLNEHMSDPRAVARRIAAALARNGWRPPRSKLHLLRSS